MQILNEAVFALTHCFDTLAACFAQNRHRGIFSLFERHRLPATCTVGHFQTKRCLSSIQRADGYTPDLFVLYKEQNWFAQADDLFFSVETLLEDGDEFGDGFESIDRLDEFDY